MLDDDDETTPGLSAMCTCGSGEDFGSCCGTAQSCDCGSEQPAGECCYAQEVDAEYDATEWN